MRVVKLVSKILSNHLEQNPTKNKEMDSEDQDAEYPELDLSSVLKAFKKNVKFVNKNISEVRSKVSIKLGEATAN